ncbi:MAG: hypothetical protein KDK70_26790 [Myxococcales bacterium]|nr:hypothetical protein [Myxococcales bacterium]
MTRAAAMLCMVASMVVAGPVRAAAPSVSLEVDVSALPEGKATRNLEAYLVDNQTRTLEDEGLVVDDDAEMTIRVIINRYGEGDINYRATLAVLERGRNEPKVQRTITCDLCRDGDLVLRVSEEVSRLSAHVLYAPKEPQDADPEPNQPQGAGEPEPEQGAPADETTPTPTRSPARLGPLGFSGIASMVVGVGATAGGIPLALRPDRARPAESGVDRQRTRPAGLGLIGAGSALLVTGAALVAIDAVRQSKPRAVSWLPHVTPSALTISMQMRF